MYGINIEDEQPSFDVFGVFHVLWIKFQSYGLSISFEDSVNLDEVISGRKF
jgi:hypothetical protein